MQNNDLNITLNFEFSPRPKATPITGQGVADFAVQSIAFRAGEKQKKQLGSNLRRDFGPIVDRELSKMARQVATMAVGLSNSNSSPSGSLKIDGPLARSMKGNTGPMRISSVTGQWKERSKSYLKWKAKTQRTRRWFKNAGGQLQSELSQLGTYRQAYGPMGVKFTPQNIAEPTIVNLGRSRGRPSKFIVTGRLEVTVFSKLGISDLPRINEKAKYSKRRLSGFTDGIQRKLTGPNPSKKYRPIIEPFLTYYMNRKIPNAVFRKVEQAISA